MHRRGDHLLQRLVTLQAWEEKGVRFGAQRDASMAGNAKHLQPHIPPPSHIWWNWGRQAQTHSRPGIGSTGA